MAKKLPNAPRKSPFIAKLPVKSWLSYTNWWHSTQAFVFQECEKNIMDGYVCYDGRVILWQPRKRIKGDCEQLVDGDNAFGFLYNVDKGENGPKWTLKSFCCGSATSSNYVAGIHFTVEMILGIKLRKQLTGRSLRRVGQGPRCSLLHQESHGDRR